MDTLFKFSPTAATIFIKFLKTNIILLQNPFRNEAVHTSLRWKTTRPAQHLFASHNSPCLLSLFIHPPSQESWEQSQEFHELYFSSGHSLKMLRANTVYLNGTAVCHLHGLKFSSKTWAEAREESQLPASWERPTGGLRQGQATHPLRPPLEVTLWHYLLYKNALWDAKAVCIKDSKSHPGGESFWEKPRFRGLFETQRWWKGSAFCLTANKQI